MAQARVLIVEDDRVVARDIQQQLERMGHTVVGTTARGEEALPLVLQTCPDIVLMDVRLEGEMDGVDAAQSLRTRTNVPVIFLTAYADDETVRRATRTEPFGYILKPFEDVQLRTVVEMALYKADAERRLRESERRYATTLSSIGDAVIATDADNRVTFMNSAAEKLTGWRCETALRQDLAQIFRLVDETPGQPLAEHEKTAATLHAAPHATQHAALLSASNKRIPVEASASPIIDDMGREVGFVLVFRDITERRQAEAAEVLRETNMRLELAMCGSDIGVWEIDMPDGDYRNGHARFSNIWERLGYLRPGSPVDYETYMSVVHPDDRPRVDDAVQTFLSGQSASFELEHRMIQRDGASRWMLSRGTAQRDPQGRAVRFTGSVVDITDLKRTEEALRESEARFRGTFENAAVGVIHIDLDGSYLRVNQRFCEILGYARETLLDLNIFASVFPDHRDASTQGLNEVIDGKRTLYTTETPLLKSNGEPVWVNLSVAMQRDERGDAMHIIAIVEDISERRLLASVARNARDTAEAANRAKDQFLANISHELRTPLNGILGYAQLLRRDEKLGAAQLRSVGVIQQSGEHLLTLINDILDFSRIAASKLELTPSDVSLPRFLDMIAEIVQVRAEQKNLSSVFTTSADLPKVVRVDERRLRQILLNLLANAIKFTDFGSVSLRVHAKSAGRLLFEIEDTGVGITEDRLDSIFLPFEQAGDLTRRSGGAGLGLAISRHLARMMGGDIRVKSAARAGSLFSFAIDARTSDVSVPALRKPQAMRGYEGAVKRILVIDDIAVNRAFVVDALASIGFAVSEAVDGNDGVSKARESRPDLILIDSVMPGVSGVEALRQLKESPSTSKIPVVVISADVSDYNMRASKIAGADHFLPKPIDLERLLTAIGSLLQLEWTYPALPAAAPLASCPVDPEIPPREDLARFHRLATLGSMRDITEEADRLVARDARYCAFAAEVRRLAEGFESQTLLKLTERYLGDRA